MKMHSQKSVAITQNKQGGDLDLRNVLCEGKKKSILSKQQTIKTSSCGKKNPTKRKSNDIFRLFYRVQDEQNPFEEITLSKNTLTDQRTEKLLNFPTPKFRKPPPYEKKQFRTISSDRFSHRRKTITASSPSLHKNTVLNTQKLKTCQEQLQTSKINFSSQFGMFEYLTNKGFPEKITMTNINRIYDEYFREFTDNNAKVRPIKTEERQPNQKQIFSVRKIPKNDEKDSRQKHLKQNQKKIKSQSLFLIDEAFVVQRKLIDQRIEEKKKKLEGVKLKDKKKKECIPLFKGSKKEKNREKKSEDFQVKGWEGNLGKEAEFTSSIRNEF